MIVKVQGGYQVVSTKGKNLGGPYQTLKEAKKRLREVEFFKHRKGLIEGRAGTARTIPKAVESVPAVPGARC